MFTLDQELTKRMSQFKTLEDFRMQARMLAMPYIGISSHRNAYFVDWFSS